MAPRPLIRGKLLAPHSGRVLSTLLRRPGPVPSLFLVHGVAAVLGPCFGQPQVFHDRTLELTNSQLPGKRSLGLMLARPGTLTSPCEGTGLRVPGHCCAHVYDTGKVQMALPKSHVDLKFGSEMSWPELKRVLVT